MIMTQPTLEQFLDDVKNHELTIHQNDGVYRHLTFKNPNDFNRYFNITTFPNYLVITGDMGALVFFKREDMFSYFRSDDLNIYPDCWAAKIQSTSWIAKDASFLEFDMDEIKEYAQENLNDFLEKNMLSELEEEELLEEFDREILSSEYEYEIIEAVKHFDCNGFHFMDFYEYDYRKCTGHYIWLCYAIVWGIKKFDEVSI